MKSLKAIRMIKSLNCNLTLCATGFLKHRKMGHTIIVVVKRLSKELSEWEKLQHVYPDTGLVSVECFCN